MRLVECEQKVKELIRSDKNNPEIYNLLQQMILFFLKRKKAPGGAARIEEISYTMAGDVYMKILQGDEIEYFLGYFEKKYREYFKDYYEVEKYMVPFDPILDDPVYFKQLSGTKDYSESLNRVYLEKIERVIDKVMEKGCRYPYNSYEYLNIKLSLMISLLRGEVFRFHVGVEEEFDIKMLIVSFYEKVKKEGINFSGR